MKRILRIALLSLLAIGVSLALAVPAIAADCDIAGAWVGNSPPIPGIYNRTLITTFTVTPTDPSGKRFAGVGQPVNPPSSPADFVPDGIVTYVRSGPRIFQFTMIAYTVKADSPERGQIMSFWTFSGTAECTGANTLTLNGMISFYDKSTDSNDDGLPDVGAQPYFRAPWGFIFNRLPLMTP
jgi:hypothetical protein